VVFTSFFCKHSRLRTAAQYLVPVAAVALATVIHLALDPWLGVHTPYTTFYPAIIISAIFGGLWPGILSLVLSTVAACTWLEEPGSHLLTDVNSFAGLVLFVAVNGVNIAICLLLRKSRFLLKRRNAQLDAERRRWKAVFEGIADEVWICDAQGKMSVRNLPDTTCMGIKEFSDKSVQEVLAELEILNPDGKVRPVEDAPLLRSLRGEIIRGEEIAVNRRTGLRRSRQFSSAPIRDSEGKITGAIAIARDITDLRTAEEDLRRRIEEIQTLMDIAPVAIWVASDPDCKNIIGNLTADQFYEACKGENVATGTIEDMPVGPRRFFRNGKELAAEELPMQQAAAGNIDVQNAELDVLLPSGSCLTMLGNAKPLRDSKGMVRGCVGAFINITERKRAERALKEHQQQLIRLTNELKSKNEELESVVSIASHDLRSPVVNLMGFSGELARSTAVLKEMIAGARLPESASDRIMAVLDSEIPEEITFIESSTRSIDQMLRSLLKVVHVVLAQVNTSDVDTDKILASVAAGFEPVLKARSIQLAIEPLPRCHADPALMKEIFSNLIDNAVRYLLPDRPGQITIRGFSKEAYSVYCVEDNGRGIAPEHQHNIFKLFHRLDLDTGGEGIGLTIVRRLVDRQYGNVWLDSRPGRGSIFYVAMPKT
jgi:PAS domain S-box-containing protein